MDDLISRQSVNDAMDRTCDLVCEYSKEQRYTMCGACPLGCAFDAVADVPSAQRKGKWIMHIDDLFPVESTKECSKCHHEQSLIIDDNFCPNCGARMSKRLQVGG